MGFVIKTETERNPISQGPTPEQTRIQELEAEVKQHNDSLKKTDTLSSLICGKI